MYVPWNQFFRFFFLMLLQSFHWASCTLESGLSSLGHFNIDSWCQRSSIALRYYSLSLSLSLQVASTACKFIFTLDNSYSRGGIKKAWNFSDRINFLVLANCAASGQRSQRSAVNQAASSLLTSSGMCQVQPFVSETSLLPASVSE